jgi:DNA-binding NarL/FixJ family response regulator
VIGWPLVGREDELQRVDSALARERGVLLAGPAGAGKTRLLNEALRHADERGDATVTIVASRSSESIPLGCLSGLLAASGEVPDGAAGLVRARRALEQVAKGRRLVLAIDDAQWLDDASAALVHQLIAGREAVVVATARDDENLPSVVTAMWKDALLERVDVHPLGRDDIVDLLERVLGGQVERSSAVRLADRCRGNAQLLAELVDEARRLALVRQQDGIFVIGDPPARSARLAELVADRVGDLDDASRTALELIALGEPLPLAVLERLVGVVAVERLEERGLATVHVDGLRVAVRLVHPVHGDVVRAQLPELRRRRLLQSLADDLEARGTRRPGDRMRLTLLRLDAGVVPEPELLVDASREAFAAFIGPVAERLARAAHDVAPSFETARLLGSVLYERGEHVEQQAVLDEAARRAVTEDDRAEVAMARAASCFWGLGERESVQELLREVEASVVDEDARWMLRGTRAVYESQAGDHRRALELLEGCPDPATLGPRAHALVVLALAFALPGVGRSHEGIAAIDAAIQRRSDDEPVLTIYTVGLLAAARSMALVGIGELDDAATIAILGYETALRSGDVSAKGFFATTRAWVELHRGQLAEAIRCYREGAVAFRASGHRGPCRWALGGLLFAAGLARDREVADEARRSLAELGPHPAQMLEVAILRAHAWAALADGDPSGARAALAEATALARTRGLPGEEAACLHDHVRIGGAAEVVDRLGELATQCDGELVPVLAAHAAAVVHDDVDGMAAAATRFEAMGFLLKAAEASMAASEAAARAGDQRRAARLARAATDLVDQCETPATTPLLTMAGGPVPLTNREREVAELAAAGLASKVIAERLFLSTRTVDNHLARIYAKLGVSSRAELPAAIG